MTEAHFAHEVSSVRAARLFACEALDDIDPAVREMVAAVVGELASNSVRHAATGFTVGVEREPAFILIEVTDAGAGLPVPRSPGPADPSGRGLQIVTALAAQWGTTARPGGAGKTVWARLASGPGASASSTSHNQRERVGGS